MSDIWQKIDEAEMVLIGLGEEFDNQKDLKMISGYGEMKEKLISSKQAWLFPAYQQLCRENMKDHVMETLKKLASRLENKNYFIVSVSMNDSIRRVPWKEGRLVMPCGGSVMKQCIKGCQDSLEAVNDDDLETIHKILLSDKDASIGCCPKCGSPMILNNIYAENYNENGYLQDWQIYTKWLQGTLNKKLLILELGVGMQYPSVIRFPFEKIAFYNNKAEFYRVNKNLYHLTEELSEKGTAISENAIDWLQSLC